jgi:hypothetical protein
LELDKQLAAESAEEMTGNADDVQAESLAKLVSNWICHSIQS